MCSELILKIVVDESDLHHVYVMVSHNKLIFGRLAINLCLFEELAVNIFGFHGF